MDQRAASAVSSIGVGSWARRGTRQHGGNQLVRLSAGLATYDQSETEDLTMRRVKLMTACGLAVTALSILAMPAAAREPEPLPSPESSGCQGHQVSVRNHNSGEFGASENPKSSAGPGFFFHQGTGEAVQGVKEACT
jgi:hypothetical protein